MSDPEQNAVILQQLEAVRRELRTVRRLVVLVSVIAAVFLLRPDVALWIAAFTKDIFGQMSETLAAVVGSLAVIILVAIIVSHRVSKDSLADKPAPAHGE